MKRIITSLFVLSLTFTCGLSQSKSFEMLRDKFHGCENVVSFNTSGFVARTILWVSGQNDFTKALRDVRSIRTVVIPKKAFNDRNVSLAGFMKVAKREDNFDELLTVTDHGDDLTLLIQTKEKNEDNRYLLLVEDNNEVVAMEIVGYVDPEIIRNSYHRSNNY